MKRASRKRRDRRDTADEVAGLREQLDDARATLRAIRKGEVDAVVVEGELGPRVYTLDGAEFDYRILIESMNEGALVLTRGALILYANAHFARMVGRPLERLMGSSLLDLLSADDRAALGILLKRPGKVGAAMEVMLQRPRGAPVPARISIRLLPGDDAKNASIGMVVSDMTQFRQREDLLRRFSRRLMQVQDTERTRLAADLSDNISQSLCSLLVRCQLLVDRLPTRVNGFREETIEFAKLLRTTTSEVQRITTDLRPDGLEILGLVSALRGLVEESTKRMGVPIEVSCARMTAPLHSAAELALYRVLQEALSNVERHAQARHVGVTLNRRGSVVQLTITDDGIGFDTNDQQAIGAQEGRFGLLSMRERAAAAGGSLRVKSTSSAGTEVRLSVPVLPPPPPASVNRDPLARDPAADRT